MGFSYNEEDWKYKTLKLKDTKFQIKTLRNINFLLITHDNLFIMRALDNIIGVEVYFHKKVNTSSSYFGYGDINEELKTYLTLRTKCDEKFHEFHLKFEGKQVKELNEIFQTLLK